MPAEDNKEKRRRMVEEVRNAVFSLSDEELEKKKQGVVKRLLTLPIIWNQKLPCFIIQWMSLNLI